MNGSGGTDHGTAGAAFLLGGAVAGGRVVHDWPGLRPRDLHEGRDLRPTLDLRAVWKGVLRDHLGLPERALATRVFPGSEAVAPLDGLVREPGARWPGAPAWLRPPGSGAHGPQRSVTRLPSATASLG